MIIGNPYMIQRSVLVIGGRAELHYKMRLYHGSMTGICLLRSLVANPTSLGSATIKLNAFSGCVHFYFLWREENFNFLDALNLQKDQMIMEKKEKYLQKSLLNRAHF